MTTKGLGENQIAMIKALIEHKRWVDFGDLRCSWVFEGPHQTRKILNTLVTRGIVTRTDGGPDEFPVYTLTKKGNVDDT